MMRECVQSKTVPHCSTCNGLVKPDIVFFGESLPKRFFDNLMAPAEADLVIVMGTSLTVMPFASLPSRVSEHTPRLLVNMELAGTFGSRPDDVIMLGDCDTSIRKLAAACGWLDQLEGRWASTAPREAAAQQSQPAEKAKTTDETVEDEVQKLTDEIAKTLKRADEHRAGAKSHMEKTWQELLRQSKPHEKPVAQDGSKTLMAPSATDSSKIVGSDIVGEGLSHVFPHLRSKSTL
jgi:NAD-dependent protein deacetylase SIR2